MAIRKKPTKSLNLQKADVPIVKIENKGTKLNNSNYLSVIDIIANTKTSIMNRTMSSVTGLAKGGVYKFFNRRLLKFSTIVLLIFFSVAITNEVKAEPLKYSGPLTINGGLYFGIGDMYMIGIIPPTYVFIGYVMPLCGGDWSPYAGIVKFPGRKTISFDESDFIYMLSLEYNSNTLTIIPKHQQTEIAVYSVNGGLLLQSQSNSINNSIVYEDIQCNSTYIIVYKYNETINYMQFLISNNTLYTGGTR
ncbi:MAG: hypothetical protein FWG85_02085 [Bacteroidetes bacterium]|nr:hypothetical protein [Bacteroidota bacterium]